MDYATRQFLEKLRKELRELLQTIHKDFQDYKEAVNAEKERNRQERHIQPLWLGEILTKCDQSERNKTAYEKRHERIQKSISRAAWAAFFAALFYGAVATFQWIELNTGNINQSAAILSSGATADRSLLQTRRTFETQQRAWVSASAELLPTSANPNAGIIAYQVAWKNTGPTPALEAHLRQGHMYKERDYLVDFDISEANQKVENPTKKSSRSVIAPNDGGHSERWDTDAPLPKKHLYLLGILTYTDIFHQQHTTTYCQRLTGQGLVDCNIGNDMN